MNILRFHLVAALAAVSFLCTHASADTLTFVEDIPTDIIFGTTDATGAPSENPQGSASSQGSFGFRNADGADEAGTRTRGQSFTFATGDGMTHEIGILSVSLNTPLNNGFRPDGDLELTIFEWDSSNPDEFTNWAAGTGGVFTTGHNEIYRASFRVLAAEYGLAGVNQLLAQISFDPGSLQLTDGVSYGFIFRYTLDDLVDDTGAPLSADVSFAFDTRQHNSLDGGVTNFPGALLNTANGTDFATVGNGSSASRDMNFFFAAPATDVLKGDVNLDGMVDFFDIQPFIDVLSSGGTPDEETAADANCDGMVDFFDIQPFIDILSS